jgi:hypothetical protein
MQFYIDVRIQLTYCDYTLQFYIDVRIQLTYCDYSMQFYIDVLYCFIFDILSNLMTCSKHDLSLFPGFGLVIITFRMVLFLWKSDVYTDD